MDIEQIPATTCSAELERECTQFLYREAELLDNADYSGWLETCLSADLTYRVPIRTTRERTSAAGEFSGVGFHMKETYKSMEVRVKRLLTDHAWAEDPASRTRRVVTNVRARRLPRDE